MRNSPLIKVAVALVSLTSLAPLVSAQTTYNAYNDFYLSPTAAGWGGATNPSTAGSTWGYYYANVNANGFPTTIGQYFTPQGIGSSPYLYKYSDVSPLGGSVGREGVSGYSAASGANFGYYADSYGLQTSLGRVDTPTVDWFSGAPGISQGISNYIWMQSGYLGVIAAEGIAPVLTWTAPKTGTFIFSGLFVSGDQPGNTASVAIVDSRGATNLARTVLDNNSTRPFAFTASYAAGDVVQFQVGNNFTIGNAVGLKLDVIAPVSTNVILTLQTTTNLTKPWTNLPVTPAMITPAGELNVGSLTNTNTFYRLQIRTAVQ